MAPRRNRWAAPSPRGRVAPVGSPRVRAPGHRRVPRPGAGRDPRGRGEARETGARLLHPQWASFPSLVGRRGYRWRWWRHPHPRARPAAASPPPPARACPPWSENPPARAPCGIPEGTGQPAASSKPVGGPPPRGGTRAAEDRSSRAR